MEQHTYRYLQELTGSDFQIVDDEPNIIGWEVKNENGTSIGEVEELLFDPNTNAVRYLIINMAENGMNLEHKSVMIPLGIAHLHTSDDEVVLPGLHTAHYNALPAYQKDQVGPELEVQIREVIGSPAALRMEETMVEFDQNQFYNHHHFDKGRFYQRGGVQSQTNELPADEAAEQAVPVPDHMVHHPEDGPIPSPGRMSERSDEQETIHELIEKSKDHRQDS